MLINGGSPLSYGNDATPTPNPRATQQSSLMWKVDGKRVSAKDLMQAI